MVACDMPKLTKTLLEAASPRSVQYTLWCSELPGFGVYILPSGQRTYFVDYRNTAGTRRRLTIGRHGKLTADQARKLAISMMGKAASGEDPALERTNARKAITFRELCKQYLDAADRGLILGKRGRSKKRSTIDTDRGRIARHIIPLLGHRLVRDIEAADINRFFRDISTGKTAVTEKTANLRGKAVVKGGAGTASRTAGLLGGLLSFAVSEGVIAANPARGVKRPSDNQRIRRLAPDEYAKLGNAIRSLEHEGAIQGPAAIWLIALTGCRSGEIIKLKWEEVDRAAQCFRLSDSKEGASVRPIGRPALDVVESIERKLDCQYVLAPLRQGETFGGLSNAWAKVIERSGIGGVTPHTLRHSFASTATDLGFSELTIAALLGHRAGSVTSRYIHQLDTVLLSAADKVATEIQLRMSGKSGPDVTE